MNNSTIEIMDALSITLSSMTIVLLTLLLISFVLASFKYIFKPKAKASAIEEVANTVDKSEFVETDEDEDDQVVACLAASIMAGDGKLNPNLHIKRITRIK